MSSFTLRGLDPTFWARVQAKAKTEGVTVRALILRLLTTWLGVAALAAILLLTTACAPPFEPTPPSPPSPAATVTPPIAPPAANAAAPMTVSFTGTPNGITVGQTARFFAGVQGSTGAVSYTFTFSDGTVVTSGGSVSHTFGRSGDATLSVTARDSTSAATAVLSLTVHDAAAPSTPPAPTDPVLQVSLTCTAKAAGSVTPCNVSPSYNGAAILASGIVDVDWDFGDGQTSLNQTDPVESHLYLQDGTYTVSVTVTATTADGPKTASSAQALTIN